MAGFLMGAKGAWRLWLKLFPGSGAGQGAQRPAACGFVRRSSPGGRSDLGPARWAAVLGPPQTGRALNSRGTASLLKDSISFTDVSASGLFEGHDLLRRGFTSVKNELLPSHPLELTEKNIPSHKRVDVLILRVFCHDGGVQILKLEFQLNQDKTNFARLRNVQGIHAPLKLQMEFRAVKQVQRLPFLHSSNMAMDILRGNDECIGFEDILNDPSQSEVMGEPHMMMEHKLGLL